MIVCKYICTSTLYLFAGISCTDECWIKAGAQVALWDLTLPDWKDATWGRAGSAKVIWSDPGWVARIWFPSKALGSRGLVRHGHHGPVCAFGHKNHPRNGCSVVAGNLYTRICVYTYTCVHVCLRTTHISVYILFLSLHVFFLNKCICHSIAHVLWQRLFAAPWNKAASR